MKLLMPYTPTYYLSNLLCVYEPDEVFLFPPPYSPALTVTFRPPPFCLRHIQSIVTTGSCLWTYSMLSLFSLRLISWALLVKGGGRPYWTLLIPEADWGWYCTGIIMPEVRV